MSLRVGKYIIEDDAYGLILYEERKKKKRVKGQTYEETDEDMISLLGYYSSLSGVGNRILQEMAAEGVAESKSLKAILECLQEGRKELKEAFSKVRSTCAS